MAPYSMDLRTRVLRDSEAGMASKDVAIKYAVSRAWVDRVKQRRRASGETRPRVQTRWRTPLLAPHTDVLEALIRAQPDRTLAELQAALPTSVSLVTVWRAVRRLGFRLKKNGTRVRAATR
jgi:transposase